MNTDCSFLAAPFIISATICTLIVQTETLSGDIQTITSYSN